MYAEKIKSISNPYDYSTHRLNSSQFIGREKHIDNLVLMLEEFKKTSRAKNVLISGDKSIGKSSLLYRFEQKLLDYNFFTYNIELSKDKSSKTDEFDFFKELFNTIFEKFSPIEDTCLDSVQQEIWYSLTSHNLDHKSSFLERKLGFASQYANRKKGIDEKLSIKILEKDFKNLIEALILCDCDIYGIAILIDEFQELDRNSDLIDILRQLTEIIPEILIIGCGLPNLLDNPSFEKFCRTSALINLHGLEKKEILNLIYKPLEISSKLSRFEVQQYFATNTIQDVVERSGGNPLHIRILCAKIFDYLKNNPNSKELEINRDVMERVMDYYSTVSEKSRIIKNALQNCTKEQLNTFGNLYYYEGLNIRSIILLQLAFESIQPDKEEETKIKLLDDLKELDDLKLFEIKPFENFDNLYARSALSLSDTSYYFVGDKIDKLYALYYYEGLTETKLKSNDDMKFEDLLAREMLLDLNLAVLSEKLPQKLYKKMSISTMSNQKEFNSKDLISDYDTLSKINLKETKSEGQIAKVKEISEKHELEYPAHIASQLQFKGYYVLMIDVSVKGHRRIIKRYYPVLGDVEKIKNVKEQIIDYTKLFNASLNEYMIVINWMYLYWLPNEALLNVIFVDLNNETSVLMERAKLRDFDDAIFSANRIAWLTQKYVDGKVMGDVNHMNNFAFCLINVNAITEAKEVLFELKDRYIISKCNYSFILIIEEKWQEAKKLLKNVLNKINSTDEEIGFLHLAIIEKEIENKNRIVEDVLISNVLRWNLALIFAYYENDEVKYNAYLKKVIFKNENNKYVHNRVLAWINYYKKDYSAAIDLCDKTLNNVNSESNLHNDVVLDKKIFSKNVHFHVAK